jgi:hypothetical protein
MCVGAELRPDETYPHQIKARVSISQREIARYTAQFRGIE